MVVERQLEVALAKRGWTIAQLAGQMGVTRQSVHRWKSGRYPWPPDRITQAAVLLRVPVAELTEEA